MPENNWPGLLPTWSPCRHTLLEGLCGNLAVLVISTLSVTDLLTSRQLLKLTT